jgi:hypothetical protein
MSLSVIVVSDYQAGEEKSWEDEISILEALSNQDFEEPFEVFLIENIAFEHSIPNKVLDAFKGLQVIFSKSHKSSVLKNMGAKCVTTDFVAVMEADCIPSPKWLSVMCCCLKENKEYSIASGKTTYGSETTWKRVLSLLDRSFDNLEEAGQTPHISNNGAIYRREVLQNFPYSKSATPFLSSRLRINRLLRRGHKFYFEPRAIMHHAIGGLGFIVDFRRNTGYADMMCHADKKITQIPFVMKNRFVREVADCLRLSKNLKWYDWPLAITLQLIVPFLGIPGMFDALIKRPQVANSSYR